MKVEVWMDEKFPYYWLSPGVGGELGVVDMPRSLYEKYEKIREEFEKVQDKIGRILTNA